MPHRLLPGATRAQPVMNNRDPHLPGPSGFPMTRYSTNPEPADIQKSPELQMFQQQHHQHQHQPPHMDGYASISSADSFSRPSVISQSSKSSTSSVEDTNFVRLARRRATKSTKERATQRKSTLSRPQGRPLSKETRIRLTLVPTMGILYSILVSDTLRKPLKVVKYSNDDSAVPKTNEEISTKNVISGFSSLLNVQAVRFSDDPTDSPARDSSVPQSRTIDEAVYNLFGCTEYSLIRVTRAAATEVGGSVLLKIETAMPGYLFLNDDEDDDFDAVEMNKELYQESIGNLGDRPTTTFLKKRVARPRYKSDMRIYLIPRSTNCAIYCEWRIFKRDLLRGFLDFTKGDRSIIVGFDYAGALRELQDEGHAGLITKYALPTMEEVEQINKSIQETAANSDGHPGSIGGYAYQGHPSALESGYGRAGLQTTDQPQRAPTTGAILRRHADASATGEMSVYDQNVTYLSQQQQGYQTLPHEQQQQQTTGFGYPVAMFANAQQLPQAQHSSFGEIGPSQAQPQYPQGTISAGQMAMMSYQQQETGYLSTIPPQQVQNGMRPFSSPSLYGGDPRFPSQMSSHQQSQPVDSFQQQQQQQQPHFQRQPLPQQQQQFYPQMQMDPYQMMQMPSQPPYGNPANNNHHNANNHTPGP